VLILRVAVSTPEDKWGTGTGMGMPKGRLHRVRISCI